MMIRYGGGDWPDDEGGHPLDHPNGKPIRSKARPLTGRPDGDGEAAKGSEKGRDPGDGERSPEEDAERPKPAEGEREGD